MANPDRPRGFWIADARQNPTANEYQTAAAQTIAVGDAVLLDGSGQVTIALATSGTLLGVASTSVSASSAGDAINIYDNPETEFAVQCSGSFALTDLGVECDLEGTTGVMECNENASTYSVLRIVGYDPATAVGANAVVYVRIAKAQTGEADGEFAKLSVAGAATVGTTLGVTGTATVGTLTDGTMTVTGGDLSAVGAVGCGSVTATGAVEGLSVTDGRATITGGAASALTTVGCGSVTATGAVEGLSVTDGTMTATGGDLSAVGSVGCASVTATGAVEGLSVTDGTMTATGGDLSAVGSVGCDSVTAIGAVEGLTVGAPQVYIESAGAPSADPGNGAIANRIIKATYDFGIHGGAQGDINIGLDLTGLGAEAIVIPAGSLIKQTYAYVETAFTSGGAATVSFEIQGANDVITATAYNDGLYTVSTAAEGIQDGTAAAMEVLAGTVHIAVATADLTGGRVHLFIEYMTAV